MLTRPAVQKVSEIFIGYWIHIKFSTWLYNFVALNQCVEPISHMFHMFSPVIDLTPFHTTVTKCSTNRNVLTARNLHLLCFLINSTTFVLYCMVVVGCNSLHDGHIVSVPRKVGTTGTRCLEGLAKRQTQRL